MGDILVSLHGDRVGLDSDGNLIVDGKLLGPNVYSRGNVFYVDSAIGSDTLYDGKTPQKPFATLDAAIGECTADQGDTIVVLPNHAETITGAGGITCDVAGITILGLGTYNQRPRFLMDGAATVTLLITAADVRLKNLVFAAGHADIVTCIGVTAKGAVLEKLEFVQNVVDENFLTAVKATSTTDNNADGLKILGCRSLSVDAAGVEFLEVNANLDGLELLDNVFISGGTAAPIVLSAGTKVLTNALIGRNKSQNANTANDIYIDNGGSTNSGLVFDNYIGNLDVTGAQLLGAATGFQFFNNLATSTYVESGAVAPAADTPNS
jgi:hypothetical protein